MIRSDRCPHCPIPVDKLCRAPVAVCGAIHGNPEKTAWFLAAQEKIGLVDEDDWARSAASKSPADNGFMPTLADTAELMPMVQACPHRSDSPACGCPAMSRCLKFDQDVSVAACMACVRDGRNEHTA